MSDDTQDQGIAPPAEAPASPAATDTTASATVTEGSDAEKPTDQTASDDGADKAEGEGGEPKKPDNRVQKRIDRLTRQLRDKERNEAELRDRLARIEGRMEGSAPKPTATSDKPRLENFASYDEYNEALTDWKVDQKLKARETEQQQTQRQRSSAQLNAERQERFLESSEDAREKYDDYDEVVFGKQNKVPVWAAPLIAETEQPAEMAYYLAKNTEEARRIYSLHPEKAAIELGKLEVKLTTPPPKRVSSAPDPARTPNGGGGNQPRSPAKMTPDQLYSRFKG